MINKIKEPEQYFEKLKKLLDKDFDFLFEDNAMTLDVFLNNRLYKKEEFESFKNKIFININDESKYRYIFEHSTKYAETNGLYLEEYFSRLIKSEIKRSKTIDVIIKFYFSLKDKITLYGFMEKFSTDEFIDYVMEFTPAESETFFITPSFYDSEKEKPTLKRMLEHAKGINDKRTKMKTIISRFLDFTITDTYNADHINLFEKDFLNNKLYVDHSNHINYSFSFEENDYNEGVMIFDEKIRKFWNDLGKEAFFDDPINKYLKESLDKYNAFIEKFQPDSIECKKIRAVLYWLVYLGIGNGEMKSRMNAIKNADVSWATKTEKTSNASFYGNSQFAKAFSSWYAFLEGKENPNKKFINNKEHSRMDKNAIALNKVFRDAGLDFLHLEKVLDGIGLIRSFAEIIEILDERIVINVNIGDYVSGFMTAIVNSVAQILNIAISISFQQLFYLKLIPFNGKKVSLSDIYNYLNFLKVIVENSSDIETLQDLNIDLVLEESLNILGVDVKEFKEIGFGAYEKQLNTKSGIIFFAKELYPSEKENGKYFVLNEDLPILYCLIEFALEKKVVQGNSYAKRNIILGNEDEIYNLLYSLSEEEIFFVFTKLGVDLSDNNDIDIDNEFIKNNNEHINIEYLNELLDGTYLYEEFTTLDFFTLKSESKGKNFKRLYPRFIEKMLHKYFDVVKYNKNKITSTTYNDQDLGDFDDFFARFLPSIMQLASLFDKEVETKKALIDILDKCMNFITGVLYGEVLKKVKEQINSILRNAQESLFKKIGGNELIEKLSFLNQKVEFDLNLGSKPFIQSLLTTLNFLEEFAIKIPKSITPCFYNSDYEEEVDKIVLEKRRYEGNTSANPNYKFEKDTDKEEVEKLEKINYVPEKKWEVVYHDKNGNIINYNTPKNNVNFFRKVNTFEDKETVEKTILSSYEKPEKIIYELGEVKLVFKNGDKETIIDKYSNLKYPILNNENKAKFKKREIVDEIISKNLSKDDLIRVKEIKNFIERVSNLEYYSIIKKIKKEERRLEEEFLKYLPNYNSIREIKENIANLTAELNSVKNTTILNTDNSIKEKITILEFDDEDKITVNLDKYRTLDDFFNTKINFIKEMDEILSDENTKESYLSTYQITQLLR